MNFRFNQKQRDALATVLENLSTASILSILASFFDKVDLNALLQSALCIIVITMLICSFILRRE